MAIAQRCALPADQNLADLRATGVRIALDGLGTAATSLQALYRIPIDELKIDGGLVADLLLSPKATAVVSSILEMGRRFSLPVVAEGVEQDRQRRLLWELGCGTGPGRLFGAAYGSADLLTVRRRSLFPIRSANPIG